MTKNLRKILWGCLALFMLEGLSGCAGLVYVRPAPPPPRYEARPPAPYESAVWVGGYWYWTGRARGYQWKKGHWRRAQSKERGYERHDRGRH